MRKSIQIDKVLAYVKEHPGCSNEDIKAILGFAQLSNATHYLNLLYDRKLVTKKLLKPCNRRPVYAWYDVSLQEISAKTLTSMKW